MCLAKERELGCTREFVKRGVGLIISKTSYALHFVFDPYHQLSITTFSTTAVGCIVHEHQFCYSILSTGMGVENTKGIHVMVLIF